MATSQTDAAVIGGGSPASANHRSQGRWWFLVAGFVLAVGITLAVIAATYQPLQLWNLAGGFPGMHRPLNARIVNNVGGQIGDILIPPQKGTFAVSVSLFDPGPMPVTIEDVSLAPPNPDYPWSLISAGPVKYWTARMYSGIPLASGRPIAGLTLRPGGENGIYIGVPVRMHACYIPGGFQVLDGFYVKERFGPFTKWVKIPLMQPILVNTPAPPDPSLDDVCLAS
ncbi:MAG TPA: hypothetical protein VF834_00010 [Streptosporangiaceae bacterium]